MSSEPVRRALPPSVFARLADATRYVITGVSPETWFGPLQPLAPMAPPEVKGRQWDFPFGANLNYVPRSDDGVSFAELRALDIGRLVAGEIGKLQAHASAVSVPASISQSISA